jgi:hypothetical protein
MNTISGFVTLKESNVGVGKVLVELVSPTPPSGGVAKRYAAVLTKDDGSFAAKFDDTSVAGAAPNRNDLQIRVWAPEEPGVPAATRLLYTSPAPREGMAGTEDVFIRLTTAQLEAGGVPVPSEISQDLEPANSVVGRFTALVQRQTMIADGHIKAARTLVDNHRARFANFHNGFKTALINSVSTLPTHPLDPDRIVKFGESVADKSVATIKKGITDTVNSTDPAKRAPARGFISLTDAEVADLRAQADPGGVVPAAAVAKVAAKNGVTAQTTYVQALDRLPLCQPPSQSADCADVALNPPIPAPTPSQPQPTTPGPGTTALTLTDIPTYLARLIDPVQPPEHALLTGLMPVATRESIQESVKSFVFNPSPADVPTFHDFNNLQIAFEYVWQEAIDQGIIDLAQNAYETIVGLGGNPEHPQYLTAMPIQALLAEGGIVNRANATPNIVVRDHRGEAPGTRLAPPPPLNGASSSSNGSCTYMAGGVEVRDHRTNRNPMAIADPIQRLPALLEALNKKLQQKYSFTVYGANAKERSVNFGILNAFRQVWTPLAYQAGPLVKSIPLAPKQTQKVVITRKTTSKRSVKELRNNLTVLKDETSQTNRAEQDIVNKASTNTSFSFSNELKGDYKIGSDTVTTGFKHDAAKSSDDTKKSFHESVFKASQEFKEERTTEVNTETTSEYESIETTEISNPNDEIAVTFLFYELQRRYRIYERLYRVEPVVLVAQEFPQPSDIDPSWLVRYDWILRRSILDDSFLPTLNVLLEASGEETALAEMQLNVNQQRCIVQELRQELAIASRQATAQRALMDQAVYRKSGASDGGILGAAESLAGGLALGAAEKVGDWLFGGGSPDDGANRQQALQDRAAEAADQVRDITFRVEREVTALNALTETYTKALRDHNNHLTEIARLQLHVIDNIMYYMQAIWTHEPPDQRYFRLHNVPIPDFTHKARGFNVKFDGALATTMAPPHMALDRFGGRDAKCYPFESVTSVKDDLVFKPLSQVADLDRLLGFKGNYMIFPLKESNALTDFMMDPYIDRATGQLVDPSDPLNWSIDEFTRYVCCLKGHLSDAEFQRLLPRLKKIYQAILSNPSRNDDVLVVPTNSLFIAALPDSHTLLEQFKLCHRMIDVLSAEADARHKEVDTIRGVARILAGEREDPNIDQRVLIQGNVPGVVVPPPH